MKAHITQEAASICKIMHITPKGTVYLPPKDSHRNASCPCGSGKKYKRCCYGKELYEPIVDDKNQRYIHKGKLRI